MAVASVAIPSPLRSLAAGSSSVPVEGTTVGAAIRTLTERYPALRRHLLTSTGELRKFVSFYLNEEDIRGLRQGDTPLQDGDIIAIVAATAGG